MLLTNEGPDAKINARRTQISKQFTESIVSKITKKYQRQGDIEIDAKDVEVKMSLDDTKVLIEELVDNAFKFSSEGSKVSVKVMSDNDKFLLIVADHGRGMKPEQINKIGAYIQFDRDRFEQQGSGLGLIICKKLTELHGGTFTVNSEYGKETIVFVTLPGQ